ncbi:MAG: PAS domain S-box protein [Chloroflexota bacterium]
MDKIEYRVLLIEANPADVARLSKALDGHVPDSEHLVVAGSLAEAQPYLVESAGSAERTLDVVLLGLDRPADRGLQVLHRVQKLAPALPVIVLSEVGDETFTLQALQAGAQDCLVKSSLERSAIWQAVQFAVARKRHTQSFRSVFNASPTPQYIINRQTGRILDLNQAYTALVGLDRQAILGHTTLELGLWSTPDERAKIFQALDDSGQVRDLELELLSHTGAPHTVLCSADPIELLDQPCVVFSFTDITRRKQAERELIESEARFSTAFYNTPVAQSIIDTVNNRVVAVNEACSRLFGFSRDELIGVNPAQLSLWEDPTERVAAVEEMRRTGRLQPRETKARTKTGEIRAVLAAIEPISWRGVPCLISSIVDITARKQAEQALCESQENYRALAEASDARIVLLDAEGQVRYLNERAARSQGLQVEDVLGKNFRHLLPKETAELSLERLQQVIRTGQGMVVETPIGARVYRNSIQPVHDASGRTVMALMSATDITDLKIAQHELIELNRTLEARVRERTIEVQSSRDQLSTANAALEKAAHMKDEFLADMSHELRTPLTSILGLSEALQYNTYGDLTEKQVVALKNIEESGRHLLALINDILDLSKIESGKLELEIGPVSLHDICQASLLLTKGMAHKKRQSVNFLISPGDILLRADARRLKQMLVNLLSNAIKFTPENGSLGLEVRGDRSEKLVSLTVWDRGIGIAPEQMERLFQPFVQFDSSLSRQYDGSGLGLALVQRMVDLHQGSIQVVSAPGEGSRFTVLLPWLPVSAQPAQSAGLEAGLPRSPQSAQALPFNQAQILVVEDNEFTLQAISDFLGSRDFRVTPFGSGIEMLQVVVDLHPDLILMDIQMPVMDGFETIRQVRAHPDPLVAKVPIIAVTAHAMPGDRERCLAAGADGYLSKPVSFAQLVEVIHSMLAQR